MENVFKGKILFNKKSLDYFQTLKENVQKVIRLRVCFKGMLFSFTQNFKIFKTIGDRNEINFTGNYRCMYIIT